MQESPPTETDWQRNLFEKALIGMAIIAPDGKLVKVNDHLCQFLGYSQEELLQKTWRDVTFADDVPAEVSKFKEILQNKLENYVVDKRFVTKNGDLVNSRVFVQALRGAKRKPEYFLFYMQDIAVRKRLALINTILAHSIQEKDLDTFLQKAFDATAGFFGIEGGGIYIIEDDKEFAELKYHTGLPPEFVEEVKRVRCRNPVYAKVLVDHNLIVSNNIQTNFPILAKYNIRMLVSIPLTCDTGVVGSLNFGSKLRHSFSEEEKELFEILGKELGSAIAGYLLQKERYDLLKKTLEISEMKSNIITIVAHELATPLIPIYGWADFILKNLNDGKKLEEIIGRVEIEAIYRNAVRLDALIKKYLDLGRIEIGRFTFDRQRIDISVIISNAVKATRYITTENNITISVNCESQTLLVDPARIEEVFVNLVTNAAKYSPEGTQVEVEGKIEVIGGEDYYTTLVKDEGYGFTKDELEEALQPFAKASERQPQKKEIKGTGLGLYICQQILKGHGGTLNIVSMGPNKGTTVEVRIPLKRD